jgi:glycosyltransferase involved in cell wall biosynthesis
MGDYIEECLNSIKSSSYKDIEILIINDGSTDQKSIGLLKKIAADDPQIGVFDQSNKGLAFTRNAGAAMAKGRYLAFLDADDKVEETYYSKAIAVLKSKKNVFFAGCWVRYFENSCQVWPTFTPQPPYILAHNSVNSSGLVYKREAFLKGGLNDKAAGYGLEDYESVINMLHNGLNGVILPEILFHYRVRSGSMIRNISREKLLYSNKYITEKHSAYYAKFAPQIINILNANGPGYLFDNPTHSIKVTSNPEKTSRLLIKLKMLLKRNERLKKAVLLIKNKLN